MALPKLMFDKNFLDKNLNEFTNTAFISILDPDNTENNFSGFNNLLQVRMWDLEETVTNDNGKVYEVPSVDVLTQIVEFVNENSDKNFVIHCSAGVSRSGAVARFIWEKFYTEIDKWEFLRVNNRIQPNLYIYNKLVDIDLMYN